MIKRLKNYAARAKSNLMPEKTIRVDYLIDTRHIQRTVKNFVDKHYNKNVKVSTPTFEEGIIKFSVHVPEDWEKYENFDIDFVVKIIKEGDNASTNS